MEVKESITHIYIYGLLRRDYGFTIIHVDKVKEKVKRTTKLPRKYHYLIIKEMINAGLLIKITRDEFTLSKEIKVNPPKDSLGHILF